ncbi:MAG: hypothetical protein MUE40_03380 [Anaerolineae bacterium]|jgi:nicotinamidase-related amidase|nr:hypothetical protein [Anaerolineae bacterium]
MTLPAFYKPEKVGMMYSPAMLTVVEAGRSAGIAPAAHDSLKTALLLVDMQVDFIHPDGALYVPGAIEDTRRTIEWIYHNVGSLTTIIASLDSHVPLQIFSPAWWANRQGRHPAPYTVITAAAVQEGDWRPLYDEAWSKQYVASLERHAKKELMIWPYHTLIGTAGYMLTPALYEAIAYHSSARQAQPIFISKGTIANTENYSLFEPEVKRDDLPAGGLNVELLETLAGYDRIYIAGEAKSHCVLETVTSLMRYFAERSDIIARLRLLSDCMSSVVHPQINFDKLADEAFAGFAMNGLTLVPSTAALEPIG